MLMRRFVSILVLTGLVLPAIAGGHTDQVPGWFRYKLGDFQVTALQDGVIDLPDSAYQGMAAKDIAALSARAFSVSEHGVPTSVNAYLVDTGAHRILVDGGNDDCYGWKLGGLLANMKASGYQPSDIDIVLLTHLHGDHVCGLAANDKPLFPNAEVWAAADEAAYWLDPQNKKTPAKARRALELYGKHFRTFTANETIAPGFIIVPAPGHTPGHTAYRFESNGAALLIFGDIVHNPYVQFAHPEVSVGSDVDRGKAIATRQAIFAKLATENTAVAGAHLLFPGIGRLRNVGDGYDFSPAPLGPSP